MRIRFSSDDEPVDLRNLPSLAGTVLAKRLGNPLPAPTLPMTGLGLASLLFVAGLAANRWLASGLGPFSSLARPLIVLGSAVPLLAVLANHLKKGFLSRTVQWPPLSRQFPHWDALTEALRNSPHAADFRGERVRERDHLFLGVISGSSKPCLIHTLYANRPALILGRTGSGKTKLVAEALLVQLIRRRFMHPLVLDIKGDKAHMLGLASEARRARVDFKWLTIEPGKSSYLWNPFTDPAVSLLSAEQFLQVMLKAMGLVTGHDGGSGYWGSVHEDRARRTMERQPLRSMREFSRALQEQTAGDIGMNERDFANAGHLLANVARVASTDVLNAVAGGDVPEAALREAITLTDVLSKPGVTYFSLPALLEPTTALFTAKLLIHLLAAVARVFEGRRVPVLVWMDEAQEAVGPDLATPIRQSRESDITYWLGVQDLAALNTAQGDFTSAVLGNTPLKIFCSAEDSAGRDYIMQFSGERLRPLESVSTSSSRSAQSVHSSEGMAQQYREEAVPRIDGDAINRFSRDPNAFLVMASESRGFTRYRFPVVVRSTFPVSAQTLARRTATPWPRGNQFTITAQAGRAAAAAEPPDDDAPEPEAVPQTPPPAAPVAPAERPANPAPQVPQAAAAEPARPRRRGRPRKTPAPVVEAQPVAASDGTPAGLAPKSEMAEYLRRLAAEPPGAKGEEKR